MAKGDCVRCTHCVVCKYRSSNEQLWIKEHCKLAARDERPHGEWKLRSPYEAWFEEYKCSNCNAYGWFNWHFCPNCGADMRKEGDRNEIKNGT